MAERDFASSLEMKENGTMPREKTARSRRAMTPEHKAALAKGREEGLAVRRYLEALESTRPRRGRRRTPASMQKKLASITAQLASADPLTRLHLLQEKKDLELELSNAGQDQDVTGLEKHFVKVARSYGERKGITYGTWRAAGVSAAVLQKAGISRSRG
jgi:hypothetical protein